MGSTIPPGVLRGRGGPGWGVKVRSDETLADKRQKVMQNLLRGDFSHQKTAPKVACVRCIKLLSERRRGPKFVAAVWLG